MQSSQLTQSSLRLVVIAFLMIGLVITPMDSPSAQEEVDRAEIADQIGKLINALRTGDAELYASVYLEDADYINTGGPHRVGIDAVRAEAEEVVANLGAMPDFDLPITGIRFLEDDVAVVDCFVTLSAARATYYMVKRQGSWRIASARIIEPEED